MKQAKLTLIPAKKQEGLVKQLVAELSKKWIPQWTARGAQLQKTFAAEVTKAGGSAGGGAGKGQKGEKSKSPHIPLPYVRGTMTIATRLDAPILDSNAKIQS